MRGRILDEVEAAKEQFKSLTKKGHAAFLVKKDGDRGKKITEFDEDAGKIILIPHIAGG